MAVNTIPNPLTMNKASSKHHYNSQDPNKPNFVFSSDIPDKVRTLVDKHVNNPNNGSIDLASDVEFNVNVELNSLLVRNKNLKPTDLIKENLVCLARSNTKKMSRNIEKLIFSNPKYTLEPYSLVSNEIFIVNLTLKLLEFIIDENVNQIAIDFLKDENYGLLLLCDEHMIDQIERYIKTRFFNELKKHISLDVDQFVPEKESVDDSIVSATETIIIETEPQVSTPKKVNKQVLDEVLTDTIIEQLPRDITQSLSLNDTTLDGEDIADKSFAYEDEEFNSSLEELLILRSNDTTNSNSNDEDEGQSHSTSKASKDNSKIERFIKNIDNLRHNEEEYIKLDDLLELECELDDDANAVNSRTGSLQPQLKPPIKLQPSSGIVSSSPEKSLANQSSSSSFVSPSKRKSLSRMSSASFSIINDEDNYGLEYAFNNKSPLVPKYIKSDKKFKFIKIGKVQKFVNLFEEKLGDTGEKTPTVTRPSSPLKNTRGEKDISEET